MDGWMDGWMEGGRAEEGEKEARESANEKVFRSFKPFWEMYQVTVGQGGVRAYKLL